VIDFRYHLVSIIAVFLALAVGLLVGATSLGGATEAVLTHEEHLVTQANNTLRAKNSALSSQIGADQAFAQAASHRLLSGLLTGKKVVLVVAPNADSALQSSVTSGLQQAGATVTGKIMLQQAFFDPSGQTESSLTQLARQLAPQAGVTLPTASSTVYGQQAAAAVIASCIVSKNGDGPGATVSRSILSAFTNPGGYLQVSPGPGAPQPATLAVLLTPGGAPSTSAQAKNMNQALVAVATQLQAASAGTVMAGSLSAIGPDSAISMVGGSGPSTVDNADTSSGQIIVVQALRELLDKKAPAAYGVGSGTAPSPAPTPSPSSTTTTTQTSKGKTK